MLRRLHFAALLLLLLLLLLLVGAALASGLVCPEDSLINEEDGSCKCIPMPYCPKHECPEGMQRVRVKDGVPDKPGSCCPLYECHNQATLSYDPMEESSGPHHCLDEQGQPRELGEHWLETDPCTNCSCEAPGQRRCQTTMCRSCAHPEPRAPNECCPRCPAAAANCPPIRDCLLDCPHGLLRDPDDCELCQCRPRLDCPPLRLHCSPLNGKRCPAGYRLDAASGCPICECLGSCLDGNNQRRVEGERWSHDPCRSCVCETHGTVSCNQTVCELSCAAAAALPPPPGHCCPLCPPLQEAEEGVRGGWGTIPIVLIVVLGLLCVILMVHLARSRFRARLNPREIDFAGFSHHHQQQQQQQQQQYYKCVPVYEPVLRHAEKIAAL